MKEHAHVIHKVYVQDGGTPVATYKDFNRADEEAYRICKETDKPVFVLSTSVYYTPSEPRRQTLSDLANSLEKEIKEKTDREIINKFAPAGKRDDYGIRDVLKNAAKLPND
jgi:hypothetical protein